MIRNSMSRAFCSHDHCINVINKSWNWSINRVHSLILCSWKLWFRWAKIRLSIKWLSNHVNAFIDQWFRASWMKLCSTSSRMKSSRKLNHEMTENFVAERCNIVFKIRYVLSIKSCIISRSWFMLSFICLYRIRFFTQFTLFVDVLM